MNIPDVRITAVSAQRVGTLRITWDDGVTRDVDVSDSMTRHPLLKMLNDPDVFRDVSVTEGGSGIAFGNGVDFCAQALRLKSDEQTLPDTRKTA
jgi:hypothetical protein